MIKLKLILRTRISMGHFNKLFSDIVLTVNFRRSFCLGTSPNILEIRCTWFLENMDESWVRNIEFGLNYLHAKVSQQFTSSFSSTLPM